MLLTCALLAAPARADNLDKILGYLVQAGVIDGAVKDARPLIECLVQHNGDPKPCVDVKSIAEQQGKATVKKYTPSDPKIQGMFLLVQAVGKGDWVQVIDVAGVKVLVPLACDLGLSTTGPLKGFVCKDAMKQIVVKVAEPAVRGVLSALATGKPEVIIWEVITLAANVDLACALVPDFPGKSIPCGELGKILAELGGAFVDAAKWGGKIVVSASDAIENVFMGNDSHMSYDKYYALYWLPWANKATGYCLISPDCDGLGPLNEVIYDRCVDYFDSHNQYRSTAKKTCGDLRFKRFTPGMKALAQALRGAGEAHVELLRPWARVWAVEDYGKETLSYRTQFFVQNCEVALRKDFPLSEPSVQQCEAIKKSPLYKTYKGPFDAAYGRCVNTVKQQTAPPDAWSTACKKSQGKFKAMLNGEKAALQDQLGKIVAAGCFPPKGWTAAAGLKFDCNSYAALDVCYAVLKAGAEKQHCSPTDAAKAADNAAKTYSKPSDGSARVGAPVGGSAAAGKPQLPREFAEPGVAPPVFSTQSPTLRSPIRSSAPSAGAVGFAGTGTPAMRQQAEPPGSTFAPTPATAVAPTRDTATIPTPSTATAPTRDTIIAPMPSTATAPTRDTIIAPMPSTATAPTPATASAPARSMGNDRPQSFAVPQPTAQERRSAPVSATASPASGQSANPSLMRELAALSCTSRDGGLRFVCTARAGFDQCESLRARHRVETCTLVERR